MKNKMMHWFYEANINDEREQQAFSHILQDNHLIISTLLLAASIISLLQDSYHETLTFGTIALFLIMFASSVHLTQNIRARGLNRYYAYNDEEYIVIKKRILRTHLISTVFISICWLFGAFCAKLAAHHPFQFTFDDLLGVIIFTLCYYFIGRTTKIQKIIKEYEK